MIGSKKQVEWAEKVKASKLKMLRKLDANQDVIDEYQAIESARFIIDTREITDTKELIEEMAKHEHERENEELEKIVMDSVAIVPENKTSDIAPIIDTANFSVRVKSEYDEDLIEILKDLGARWNKPYWMIEVEDETARKNLAAQWGHKLLQEGFPVRILDDKTREMAMYGTYDYEETCWVKADTPYDKEYLYISWIGSNENSGLYEKAIKISGAKWTGGRMRVPVSVYREVLDFADIYRASVTDKAQALINSYIESEIEIKVPPAPEREKLTGMKKRKESAEVLDDLKEDD